MIPHPKPLGETRQFPRPHRRTCINLHIFAFSCLALRGIFQHFPFPTGF